MRKKSARARARARKTLTASLPHCEWARDPVTVRAGDRIIIMGARDDTLATFAADLLRALASPAEQ